MTVNLQGFKSVSTVDWGRLSAALHKLRQGKSFSDIGEEMGVSEKRARVMVHLAESRESALQKAEQDPFGLLSTRARNCLTAEVGTEPGAVDRVRKLRTNNLLRKVPNMGRLTIQEVEAWLDAMDGVLPAPTFKAEDYVHETYESFMVRTAPALVDVRTGSEPALYSVLRGLNLKRIADLTRYPLLVPEVSRRYDELLHAQSGPRREQETSPWQDGAM